MGRSRRARVSGPNPMMPLTLAKMKELKDDTNVPPCQSRILRVQRPGR